MESATTWQLGDKVHIARLDFTGRVARIVPTPDPVLVLRTDGGAELTMRASALTQELNR